MNAPTQADLLAQYAALGLPPIQIPPTPNDGVETAFGEVPDPLPLVPAFLKQQNAWVVYESKDKKAPIISGTTLPAKSNDPSTQADYQTLCANIAAGRGYLNPGFVLDGARTGYLASLDIDGCWTGSGITEKAQAVLDFFQPLGAYAEWTPNRGLHIWFRSSVSNRKFLLYETSGYRNKAQQVEMFGDGLFFTMTGDRLPGFLSEVPELSSEQVNELLALLERLQVGEKSKKGQKFKAEFIPGTLQTRAVPVEPDPAFKMLFEKVGWEPFEQRVRKMVDPRFHNFTLSDKLSFCPMPGHVPRGPDVPFTSKIFGAFGDGDVVHCFGCGFGGDMVKAVYTFDAGEEGGKISYGNMYECARTICAERGLNPEEYFPQKGVSAEPTEEQKKESGEHRLEFSEDTEVIPAFDPSVINGIYAKFVELMTRGTTLVPQYAFLVAKTYIGLRLAGKVTFATVDAQPRYFGVAIGETGSGKGAAYSRLLQILHACGSLKGSPGMIKIMNGVDSGSGLKDFFFEDPQDEGVLVYIDEAATYANKTTATRNPSALDDLLELVDQTAISRTLSVGLGKKKSKKKNDAYLAMYMCAQDGDVLQRLFAGRGKLGALDRLTPEYSVAVKPGRMPEISSSDAMQVFGEVTAMIEAAKGKTIGIQPGAEALLEAFWESQSSATQTKVRWKKYIQVDAYMSAFGLGRDTVTLEDMQIAIRIFERQLTLRRAFFKNMDVTDKVGYYLAKCKVITEWMLVQQAAGKAEWTYAQSKRDYETKTHAFREHEEAYFEKAWILHSKGRLSEIRVKKSNGHEYVKYIPTPEEPAD